jgi:hypothetical protein
VKNSLVQTGFSGLRALENKPWRVEKLAGGLALTQDGSVIALSESEFRPIVLPPSGQERWAEPLRRGAAVAYRCVAADFPLPPCEAAEGALSVAEAKAGADSLVGKHTTIRGVLWPLELGGTSTGLGRIVLRDTRDRTTAEPKAYFTIVPKGQGRTLLCDVDAPKCCKQGVGGREVVVSGDLSISRSQKLFTVHQLTNARACLLETSPPTR